jgi:carbon monoxide dehydrogenase subunit G
MTHNGSFNVARSPEEVVALLSNPEWFAPTMPDFESMTTQDATHFTMRTVFAIGEIKGHANLAMELVPTSQPNRVEYKGAATIAGGPLRLAMAFQLDARDNTTEVRWQGEVTLGGMLAMMAGTLLDTMGRQNFDRMAERLQVRLQPETLAAHEEPAPDGSPSEPDFDI